MGEVQRVQPAVVGVAAPFDVAAVLQLVDIGDDAAGQHAELAAERLLASPGFGGDGAKDACVRRGQVDGRHLFGELGGRVVSKLSQQEGDAVAMIVRIGHPSIIHLANRSN